MRGAARMSPLAWGALLSIGDTKEKDTMKEGRAYKGFPVPKAWDGKRMMAAIMDRYPKAQRYVAHPSERGRLGEQGERLWYAESDGTAFFLPGYIYADIGPNG